MTRSFCCLALLIAANARADALPDPASRNKGEACRRGASGYDAEVEVTLGGVTRHGRIIVTPDGCVHLEHLDEQARRWVSGVIRPEPTPSEGWDDRARPPQRVWGRVGGNVVLAEVHAPGGSLRVTRHKVLAAR
ncbi:MAG: hypothetical protein FJ303_12780 [Planctomycetes bacterium]|nr:hypothetical protein [Planctomycetota bacterium]